MSEVKVTITLREDGNFRYVVESETETTSGTAPTFKDAAISVIPLLEVMSDER